MGVTLSDVIQRNNEAVSLLTMIEDANGLEMHSAPANMNALLREAFRIARQCMQGSQRLSESVTLDHHSSSVNGPSRKKRRAVVLPDPESSTSYSDEGTAEDPKDASSSMTHRHPTFEETPVHPTAKPLMPEDSSLETNTDGFFLYSRLLFLDKAFAETSLREKDDSSDSTTGSTTKRGEAIACQAVLVAVTTFNMAILFHCRAFFFHQANAKEQSARKSSLLVKAERLYESVAQLATSILEMTDDLESSWSSAYADGRWTLAGQAFILEQLRFVALNNLHLALLERQGNDDESTSRATAGCFYRNSMELYMSRRPRCQEGLLILEKAEMDEIFINALTLEMNFSLSPPPASSDGHDDNSASGPREEATRFGTSKGRRVRKLAPAA